MLHLENVSPNMLLEDWIPVYWATYGPDLAPLTANSYKGITAKYLPPLLSVSLAEITPLRVKIWASTLPREISDKTRRNIIGVLQSYMSAAQDAGLIHQVPKIKLARQSHQKPVRAFLPSELATLTAEAGKRQDGPSSLILCAIETGARLGELLGLRWSDIQGDTLHIERQAVKVPGQPVMFTAPKYGSVREIPITPGLAEVFRAHKLRMMQTGRRPREIYSMSQSTVRKHFKDLLQACGLPPELRIHDIRHTVATMLLQQGTDVTTISAILGHTNPGFTLRQYTHTNKTAQHHAMRSYYEQRAVSSPHCKTYQCSIGGEGGI